jgi:undecaprenyl diphosphate synthase
VTSAPQHLAIIMDGNGRWATSRGMPRSFGHAEGTSRVKEIIREADRLGIKILTLYCFSTENWKRPPSEVSILMRLLKEYLLKEREELMKNNVRLQALGQVHRLPGHLQKLVHETEAYLSKNTGMILNFCISYGGRAEILRATQAIAAAVKSGKLQPEQITEADLENELYTRGLPDPDLIIRTSGEARVSNFLLWQCAYSEWLFLDLAWPDFRPQHLQEACLTFQTRKRRFGASDELRVENQKPLSPLKETQA